MIVQPLSGGKSNTGSGYTSSGVVQTLSGGVKPIAKGANPTPTKVQTKYQPVVDVSKTKTSSQQLIKDSSVKPDSIVKKVGNFIDELFHGTKVLSPVPNQNTKPVNKSKVELLKNATIDTAKTLGTKVLDEKVPIPLMPQIKTSARQIIGKVDDYRFLTPLSEDEWKRLDKKQKIGEVINHVSTALGPVSTAGSTIAKEGKYAFSKTGAAIGALTGAVSTYLSDPKHSVKDAVFNPINVAFGLAGGVHPVTSEAGRAIEKTFTVQEIRNQVIHSELKNTKTGRMLLKTTFDAEKQGKDIKLVSATKGDSGAFETPQGNSVKFELVDSATAPTQKPNIITPMSDNTIQNATPLPTSMQDVLKTMSEVSKPKPKVIQLPPEQRSAVIKQINTLTEKGQRAHEENLSRNQFIEAELHGLTDSNLKDIEALKRLKDSEKGQAGDVETLRKINPELVSRVAEKIREKYHDLANGNTMTDEEAINRALNLPSKSEIMSKVPDEIKQAKQLAKDYGIDITSQFDEGIVNKSVFDSTFNEADASLGGAPTEKPPMTNKEAQSTYQKLNDTEKLKEEKAIPNSSSTTNAELNSRPVGEGELLKSRLYNRIKDNLESDYQNRNVEYNQMSLAKDAEKAVNFIEKNPEEAYRVAMGVTKPPEGQTSFAIARAVLEKAQLDGEHKVVADIATNLSLRATRLGQEIVSLRGKLLDSTENFIGELVGRRLEKVGMNYKDEVLRQTGKKESAKQAGIKRIDKVASELQKKIQKDRSKIKLAQDILDSLTCK